MKKILLVLFLAIASISYSQTKVLVADETEFVATKTSCKLITTNNAITDSIVKEFKEDIIAYSGTLKGPEKHQWWERTFTFKYETLGKIEEFIKRLNK